MIINNDTRLVDFLPGIPNSGAPIPGDYTIIINRVGETTGQLIWVVTLPPA